MGMGVIARGFRLGRRSVELMLHVSAEWGWTLSGAKLCGRLVEQGREIPSVRR